MANYTMRADGSGTKAQSVDGDPAVAAECMSIATHDGETFAADDIVSLSDQGGVYRDELDVPSAGSVGSPILYQAVSGESPIVSGADVMSTWTSYSANTWQKTGVTTQCNVVIMDGVRLTEGSDKDSLADHEWVWDTNVLYVRDETGDPDTTGVVIEAGQRDHAFQCTAKDYITVNGIEFQAGNHATNGTVQFDVTSEGSNVGYIFQNCTVKNGAGDAILITAFPNVGTLTDSLFDFLTISECGRSAINVYQCVASSGNENTISNIDATAVDADGIVIRGSYWITEYADVYDGGSSVAGYTAIKAYSGGVGENSGDNNIFRFCEASGWDGSGYDGGGFQIDQWCDNNQVYHCRSWGNRGPGFVFFDCDSPIVHSNSSYGNCTGTPTEGAEFKFVSSISDLCDNVDCKNNIAFATGTQPAILVDTETSGNTLDITNNDWHKASGNWYDWNGTPGSVLATWNAFTGIGTDKSEDPLYMAPGTGDLRLGVGSPCIGAGVSQGYSRDFAGRKVRPTPNIGADETGTGTTRYDAITAIRGT